MSDFKITRVSSKAPNEWNFTDKKTGQMVLMETYTVMLEGETDAVEVNRKAGDKPRAGEVLAGGHIEDSNFGKKFKKDPGARPSSSGYVPKDEAAIKAMWAIGQAVSIVVAKPEFANGDIQVAATNFFHMVDRVKSSSVPVTPEVKPGVDEVFPFNGDEDINLDDIPF